MRTETLAILFADITGSTELYGALGDTLALEKIGKCISILTEVVRENEGKVIKTIGDEILSTFGAADDAVTAAAVMKKRIPAEFPLDSSMLKLRIGLHYGPALLEGGDIFGDSVNIAARLVKLANPGQILTSKETISALPIYLGSRSRDLGRFPIKGKREKMSVYEVLLSESAGELTLSPRGVLTVEVPRTCLLLRYHGREMVLHEDGRTLVLGRDPESDLIIDDRFASRQHARIEYSQGKFSLSDHSTNGTFVLTDKGEAFHLRREKSFLQGSGQISLGRKVEENPDELVYFSSLNSEELSSQSDPQEDNAA